jgi:hypothetical protein
MKIAKLKLIDHHQEAKKYFNFSKTTKATKYKKITMAEKKNNKKNSLQFAHY